MRGRRRVFRIVPRRARVGPGVGLPALAACLLASAVLFAAGCGGGTPQDAHEKAATFDVKIVKASFPASQAIARPARLELQVQNPGPDTVPVLAVTLDSFYYTEHFPELAADKRPVWVVEQGPGAIAKPPVESQAISPPGGAQTAYVNTWALGPLASGQTQSFVWQVMPVKAGLHTVDFSVAAGLSGKAKAQLASGAPAVGHFAVQIAPAPGATHVDPSTGRVVPGTYPPTP
ncbi:MAG: hypothetical protein ABSG95_02300 [Solirubrobacteraceae bacterium]